jgi:L-ribulose-5-phosphate 3-epimerase
MIKAINMWSFPTKLDLEGCFNLAKRLGYQGVEITCDLKGRFNVGASEEDCQNVRRLAHKAGIQLTALASNVAWTICPTSDSASEREKSVELYRRMIQISRWLGVDSILVVPGAVQIPWNDKFKPIRYDTAYERSAEFIEKLLPFAEKYQIRICIENSWNHFLTSPLELKDFVDSFDHPSVRIYFDIGNVMRFGVPHHWIEILGNKVHRVHVKDYKVSGKWLDGFCPLLEGDVPFKEVMKALKKQGYDRSLTADMADMGNLSESILKSTSKALDKILKM